MKKTVALFLTLFLIAFCIVSIAEEGNRTLTINLETATDEELAEALALILAEQRARLKTTIQLDFSELTIDKGKTQKITATVLDLPDGITAGKFTWQSSDETIATCNNGTIKGIGAGNAVITCSTVLSDGTEIYAEIAVTGLMPVQSIKLTSNKMEVMAGDIFTPEVIIMPENASNKDVIFTSSDEKVIHKNEDGQLVAGQEGKATITITAADGSGKSVKLNVTVTKKIGKYDDELTFQGLEWGSDVKTVYQILAKGGFIAEENNASVSSGSSIHFWPDNDLLFANSSSWTELPVIFRDQKTGAGMNIIKPLKKVGGYTPNQAYLYFLNPITADGHIDRGKTELCGIYFRFDNKHERGAEIFVDLLAKLEAQYGEFTRYLGKNLMRNTYKEMYNIIKKSMEGAKQYGYRDLGKEIYLSPRAICVLRGKNNTGILLMIDTSEKVTLFYSKTDTLEKVHYIQQILEAIPDGKEDAGI